MTFATTCVSPDTFKVEEVEKRIERKKRKRQMKIEKEKEEVRNKERKRKRRDEMRLSKE